MCLKVTREGAGSGSEFKWDIACGTKELKKQLVCAKGWYNVRGVLVYDLVTLGATILGG